MSSARSKAVALATGLIVLVAFGAGSASATTTRAGVKLAVCSLGQKSTKAKPCSANAALGRGVCASLVALLQPLAPGASIVGSNTNGAAPTGIDCWFLANGQRQAFNIQVVGGRARRRTTPPGSTSTPGMRMTRP